ncbi:MAG: hypothetical protein AUJ72_00090 [Candidatus Omnitrophica bacterium CG1_02_46_14]|nr:MAG: hypothetical protein AUJ72_00090 [Candidatus Omnitrophica bacterium CG1_02_46_14]
MSDNNHNNHNHRETNETSAWHKVSARETKKIVLPKHPVFDKIVAAYIIAYLQGKPLGLSEIELEFREDQHPTQQTWKCWADEETYVVDVGTEKYQLLGKGSATCAVASREGIFKNNRILAELAKITDKNNETGYLKGYRCSIVYILREMYKMSYSRTDVVLAVADAIHAWVRAQEPKVRETLKSRTRENLESENAIRGLLDRSGRGFEDFTVSRYIRDMWLTGYSVVDIIQKASFFLDANKQAREENRGMADVWEKTAKYLFANGQAVSFRTGDERLARWVLSNAHNFKTKQPFQLLLVRRQVSDPRDRNVTILTKSSDINLKALAAFLYTLEFHAQKNQEHGRWFYDDRINAMLNGTVGHGVPATRLSDKQLQTLIEVLVFKTRQLSDSLSVEDQVDNLVDAVFNGGPKKSTLGEFVDQLIEVQPESTRSKIDRQKLVDILKTASRNGNGKSKKDKKPPYNNRPERRNAK